MPERPPAVKPALQLTNQIGPRAYERWRASRLGSVTEALEQTRILDFIGPVEGRRILDLGCGDGLLTSTLAERGARAIGVDVNHAMLQAASARSERGQGHRPRLVEGRIEQLPFPDGSFDVVVMVTLLCLVADRTGAVGEAARVLRPGADWSSATWAAGAHGPHGAASKRGWDRSCGSRRTSRRPAVYPIWSSVRA